MLTKPAGTGLKDRPKHWVQGPRGAVSALNVASCIQVLKAARASVFPRRLLFLSPQLQLKERRRLLPRTSALTQSPTCTDVF